MLPAICCASFSTSLYEDNSIKTEIFPVEISQTLPCVQQDETKLNWQIPTKFHLIFEETTATRNHYPHTMCGSRLRRKLRHRMGYSSILISHCDALPNKGFRLRDDGWRTLPKNESDASSVPGISENCQHIQSSYRHSNVLRHVVNGNVFTSVESFPLQQVVFESFPFLGINTLC